MKLESQDIRTALWLRLVDHHRVQLAVLRSRNDGDLSPEQTQYLRGRIAQIKAFLALERELGDGGATNEAAPKVTDPFGVGFSQEQV